MCILVIIRLRITHLILACPFNGQTIWIILDFRPVALFVKNLQIMAAGLILHFHFIGLICRTNCSKVSVLKKRSFIYCTVACDFLVAMPIS